MGDTADALVIDRYALELAASDSAEHARLRHAVYYNLAQLDTKKAEPTASCDVIYSDGCSGRIALVCEWADATTLAAPERKIAPGARGGFSLAGSNEPLRHE